ncbi:MAG: hypothetical protein IH905_02500 [Proteobacteria bacterium]|nr:hypothetical protein [Pseudomonadota bacterium]
MTAAVALAVTAAVALALTFALTTAATLRAGGAAVITAAIATLATAAGVPIAGVTGGIRRAVTGVTGTTRRAAIAAAAIAAAAITAAAITAAAITAAAAITVVITGRRPRSPPYADATLVDETGQIQGIVSRQWQEGQCATRHKKGDGQYRYSLYQLLAPHWPTRTKPGTQALDLIREWTC